MSSEILVHVDLAREPTLAGRLWPHTRGRSEGATFEYDPGWLRHPEGFSLDPTLPLGPGPFHTAQSRTQFGAFSDCSPDRWGRVLMRRAEQRRASSEGEKPRTLREVDYLLMVSDEAREGALRFASEPDGPFLARGDQVQIPPFVALPELLAAAEHVTADSESAEDLRLLLAPGSSLGGARPKACIKGHESDLLIAKFPHRNDEYSAVLWEAVALALAARAGIEVSAWRVEHVSGKPVLLLNRFDRVDGLRVPFLSAMTMLDAADHETRSYLEIVDAIRQHGASPKRDIQALWRRVVFNVLISNTDDHLRNHGFVRTSSAGWRLSPAYDMNPVPTTLAPRVLKTNIDLDNGTASLDLALSVCEYFELTLNEARGISREVGSAVKSWRQEARRQDIGKAEIDRMASAFEHEDLKAIRGLG